MATMSRRRRRRRSARYELIAKPSGSLHPRVQKAAPEHFGIVAVDCAKARSKWMLADFYGRILVPPTPVDHTRLGFQQAIAAVQQAVRTSDLRDLVIAIEQTETIGRGANDGQEVGVVGLVSRIGDPAELLAGQGMNDPGLVAGGDVGALDRLVIGPGPFDGDDEIPELVGGLGLTQGGDGLPEALAGLFGERGGDQDAAVEIGEHPFEAGLGTIDGDDAEVLGLGLLDPGMQGARRLGHRGETRRAASSPAGRSSHTNISWLGEKKSQTRRLVRMARREEFSLRKQNTIPVIQVILNIVWQPQGRW